MAAPARVVSIRPLEHLVEVLTLCIPARYVVVSTTKWDQYFGWRADDFAEILVDLVYAGKTGGKRVLANLFVKAM